MNAEFIHNSIFFIFCLVFTFSLYDRYYIEARFMKYRFRLFALRDRLAKLVCSGKLEESNPAYQLNLSCLNDAIKHLEKIDLFSLARWRLRVEKSAKFQDEFRKVSMIAEKDYPEVIEIMTEYENIMRDVLIRNSWIIRHPKFSFFTIRILAFFLSKEYRLRCENKVKELISLPKLTEQRLATVGMA